MPATIEPIKIPCGDYLSSAAFAYFCQNIHFHYCMKPLKLILLTASILVLSLHSIAQPTLKSIAKEKFEAEKYTEYTLIDNVVECGGMLYFSSLNGKLYETNKTIESTREIFDCKGGVVCGLKANKSQIAFYTYNGDINSMYTFTPGQAAPVIATGSNNYRFAGNIVPGKRLRVTRLDLMPNSQIFSVNTMENYRYYLLRLYQNALNTVFEEPYRDLHEANRMPLDVSLPSYISPQQIAYTHAYEKPKDSTKFQRNITIRRADENGKWLGAFSNDNMAPANLKVNSSLFVNSEGKMFFLVRDIKGNKPLNNLAYFKDSLNISIASPNIPNDIDPLWQMEIHCGYWFLANPKFIGLFDENDKTFRNMLPENITIALDVISYDKQLSVISNLYKNYFITRSGNQFRLSNFTGKDTFSFTEQIQSGFADMLENSNQYILHTNQNFYFIRQTSSGGELVQLEPKKKVFTTIPFPKGTDLKEIRGFFTTENKVVVIAKTEGKRNTMNTETFVFAD